MNGLIEGELVLYKSRSGERLPDVVLAKPIENHGCEYVLLRDAGMVPADFCESTERTKPEKTGRPKGWPVEFKPSDLRRVAPEPVRAPLPPLPGTPDWYWSGVWITAADILPAREETSD